MAEETLTLKYMDEAAGKEVASKLLGRIALKQDALTAGENVTIEGSLISVDLATPLSGLREAVEAAGEKADTALVNASAAQLTAATALTAADGKQDAMEALTGDDVAAWELWQEQ